LEGFPLPATLFGQALRALALICDGLRSLWWRSNFHASRRKFFTVWLFNPSRRKAIKYRIRLPLNRFYCDLQVLARKLAGSFSHSALLSTQGQLAAAYGFIFFNQYFLLTFFSAYNN